MKLSALVALLPLFLSSSVAYAAVARGVIQARHAHVKKSTADVCTALDLDIQVTASGSNIDAGHLNVCLCQSAVSGFLDSNEVAKKVVNGVGRDGASDYFAGLIQSQKDKQECNYPALATPSCSIDSPCGFTCGDGYAPSPATNPTECVCKAPYSECNGKCGSFPNGCSSQDPSNSENPSNSQDPSKGKRDNPTCPAGKTMCGVPNDGSGYKCADITGDPESCGGCPVASPFGGAAGGKNCKDIPNVSDVICDNGACKVLSCKDGLKVPASNDRCVNPGLRRRQARGVEVIDEVLSKLVSKQLLVPGFDVAAAKQKLLLTVKVLDYDHILEALLSQNAIVGIHDLAKLKEALGLGASIHRRNPADIDSLFNLIISKGLFVNGFDVTAAKAKVAALGGFDLDHALELLLSMNAFIDIHDLPTLKARLGLN